MVDCRTMLSALVAAYDQHRKWMMADKFAVLQRAVEHARDVLAAAPQIEAPSWCETDAEQYAWQAGWEARDDAMLQPLLPVARLSKNAQVIEPANRTILVPIPAPIPVSERLPEPEDCLPWPGGLHGTLWCWAFTEGYLGVVTWERRHVRCLTTYKPMHTHWLPAHALPLPEVDQ